MFSKRKTDPHFDVEPWAYELIDYCYAGGPMPATWAKPFEPLEPSRYVPPPPPPPRPRKVRQPRARAVPPPAPAPKARKAAPKRQPPPPPPKQKPFDDWRRQEAERDARIDELLRALKGQAAPQVPEPFRVLGTPWPCTAEQLNATWRQLAFKHHPDRGGDVQRFITFKKAYEQAKQYQEGGPFIVFTYPGH